MSSAGACCHSCCHSCLPAHRLSLTLSHICHSAMADFAAELQQLLGANGGRIEVSDLPAAYQRRFGRPLQVAGPPQLPCLGGDPPASQPQSRCSASSATCLVLPHCWLQPTLFGARNVQELVQKCAGQVNAGGKQHIPTSGSLFRRAMLLWVWLDGCSAPGGASPPLRRAPSFACSPCFEPTQPRATLTPMGGKRW